MNWLKSHWKTLLLWLGIMYLLLNLFGVLPRDRRDYANKNMAVLVVKVLWDRNY